MGADLSLMTGFDPDSALVRAIRPSPNHGERKDAKAPDSIILHYTGMETEAAALARLCDPAAEVSCHYAIGADGAILQLVPEARRAWHAGKSYWAGEKDMNSASIGIELMNGGHDFGMPAYPEAQISALIALCRDIVSRHRDRADAAFLPIPTSRRFASAIRASIFLGRSARRGRHRPLRRCRSLSASDAPLKRGSSGEKVEGLQGMLAIYGYDISVTGLYGKKTEVIVAAFQRHFRPERVDGKADRSTVATLQRAAGDAAAAGRDEDRCGCGSAVNRRRKACWI